MADELSTWLCQGRPIGIKWAGMSLKYIYFTHHDLTIIHVHVL